MVGRRGRHSASAISAARSRRGARRRRGTTAGSKPSRSTSTASPAAARRRSATSPTPSAGCAPPASRCVAYAAGYTNDSYQLASAASEIWLNPLGAVAIAGPGGSNLYFKGLLDKLGVTANVYRVGTYKSAVEPFIRNDMSPEARQNYQALDRRDAGDLAAERQAGSAEGERRPVPQGHERRGRGGRRRHGQGGAGRGPGRQDRRPPRVRGAAAAARRQASDARQRLQPHRARLLPRRHRRRDAERADRSRHHRRHDRRRQGRARAPPAATPSPRRSRTGMRDKASRRSSSASTAPAARCSPPSASARRCSRPRRTGSRSSCRWAASPRRAAIGSRPRPTSSTPSPRPSPDRSACSASLPSFQGTLQKLGIGADGVKTTPLSGEPDLLKGPSPEVNRLIQTGVEAMYGRFISLVAAARHKTPAAGRPDRARPGVGRRHRAPARARRRLRRDGRGDRQGGRTREARQQRGVRYLEPPPSFRDELIDTLASDDRDESADSRRRVCRIWPAGREQQLGAAIAEVRSILTGPSIQARCLECPPVAPPADLRQRRPGPARADQGMALLIRLAEDEDAAAIAAIYRPYVEDSRISFEEQAPDSAEMARRIAATCRDTIHGWSREEDGELLGYAASSPFRTRPAYRWTVETGIYLAAEAQGRGIGRALLSTLIERARTAGLCRRDRRDRFAQPGERRAAREARLSSHRHLSAGRLQARRVARCRTVAKGAGVPRRNAARAAAVRLSRRA